MCFLIKIILNDKKIEQYILVKQNNYILFSTIYYIKLNLKLKIDPKMIIFKSLEKIKKTWKNFLKLIGNPEYYKNMIC